MPHWWPTLLLVVFATHGPYFALRWWQTREARFLAATITFALLVVTYSLVVFAADATIAGVPAFWWVRVPAWLSAVISLGLLVRHGLSRRGSRPGAPPSPGG
jgi:hypothetical protein